MVSAEEHFGHAAEHDPADRERCRERRPSPRTQRQDANAIQQRNACEDQKERSGHVTVGATTATSIQSRHTHERQKYRPHDHEIARADCRTDEQDCGRYAEVRHPRTPLAQSAPPARRSTSRRIYHSRATARWVGLHRGTGDRAVGAKHTAVPGLRSQHRATSCAVVKVDARINGHRFGRSMPTIRAREFARRDH